MKNLSLILNIVLLIAVAFLFYKQFSPKGGSTSGSSTEIAGDLTIAFINSDSVVKHYKFLDDKRVILEAKTQKMDKDFRTRAQNLQNEITAYQRNVSNMTIGQAKALEEDLAKKQQNLQMYQQSLNQEVMKDESELNKELYDRITAFLKTYSEENGLQVVLKFDQTSDVLYGKEILDITKPVIEGLNSVYAADKSGNKPKADSVTEKK